MLAFAEITEVPVVDPANQSSHSALGLSFGLPFDLQDWIDEHRHELKPPVANRLLWSPGEAERSATELEYWSAAAKFKEMSPPAHAPGGPARSQATHPPPPP